MNFLSKLTGSETKEAGGDGQDKSGMGLGGIFSSLKEASKDLVEVYKRDLGEFAAVVKKDTNEAVKKTAGSIEKSVSEAIKAEKGAGIDDTKKMSKLEAMQADAKSYTIDPVPASSYSAFVAELVIGERAEEISQILQASPHVSAFHNDLVPEKVEYKEFWSRYFFRANVIKTEEERKKKILQASELFDGEDDFNWDEEETGDMPAAVSKEPDAVAAQPGSDTGVEPAVQQHTQPAKTETMNEIPAASERAAAAAAAPAAAPTPAPEPEETKPEVKDTPATESPAKEQAPAADAPRETPQDSDVKQSAEEKPPAVEEAAPSPPAPEITATSPKVAEPPVQTEPPPAKPKEEPKATVPVQDDDWDDWE